MPLPGYPQEGVLLPGSGQVLWLGRAVMPGRNEGSASVVLALWPTVRSGLTNGWLTSFHESLLDIYLPHLP